MRVIKFRGKRIDNGEWVYGYLYGPNAIIGMDSTYTVTSLGVIISGIHEVIPETIGQYTGLHDKRGAEIYEGDVVRTHFSFGNEVSQEPFVIIWDKERAMFKGIKPEHSKDDYLASFSFFPEQRFIYEVIGNIHENPELLEVKG